MAFDPNLLPGSASKNPMNSDSPSTDFSEWYQNEESFDFSSFMSGSGNLELCNDELFQNLFPPNSPHSDNKDNIDFNDLEVENSYFNAPGDSLSACSSAAPSPVPVNYFNTPPVTPQSERLRPTSPHHLQFDGLTTAMSSSRFASTGAEEPSSSFVPGQRTQVDVHSSNNNVVIVKEELASDHLFQAVPYPIKSELKNTANTLSGSAPSPTVTNLSKRSSTAEDSPISTKKSKIPPKGTIEYLEKRKRNNVAVRRSRDKAKLKAAETQQKVEELSQENEKLHKRVAELTHELTTLKKLLQHLPLANS